LYLLCFASHRFRQINDNLIEAFIHLVDRYEQQAKVESEIAAAEAMTEVSASLQAAGQVLNLFLDPSIADWTPFSKVRQQAFSLLDAERFAQVSEYMRKIEFDKTAFEWSYSHIKEGWILLYIERWLTAPFETAEGEQLPRERGTPQGGVVSPILMNLFMHYTFDVWMKRTNPYVRLPAMPTTQWFIARVKGKRKR
jgi:hypothetical protein